MKQTRSQTYFLIAFLALAGVAAVLWAASYYGRMPIHPYVSMGFRWVALLALCGYAFLRRSLTAWIFAGMLVGAELGHELGKSAANLQLLSAIFLRLIKTIIAPLIFSTLVVGIAGHSNLKQVGRMGIKALLYFEVVTTIALFLGLAAINLTKAGVGVTPPTVTDSAGVAGKPQTAAEAILNAFPENVAKAVADGHVLQIVVFSVLFGIALALVPDNKRQPVLTVCGGLAEVMFKFTKLVMYFAPIGVGAAMAYTVGHMGLDIVKKLFFLLATLYVALIAFLLFVLFPVALIARVPLKRFLKAIAEPVSIAFATTSSEAALPLAMERMEQLGVPRQIVAFVMPAGYSFNLDGTTLYLSLASVFVAQAAGIHMGLGQQLLMVFTLMLTSKGVAGVPRASLVILLGTAASFNLPVEPIFIILGIDELMDMARTSVNVIGNCLATVVIAQWEGEFGKEATSETVRAALV